MNSTSYSEEVLSAWIDGEVEPVQSQEIERALETDPELAARIAAMRTADKALRSAFQDQLGPVPDSLSALAAQQNNVVAFPKRRPENEWRRIAATGTVALIVGAGAMSLFTRSPETFVVAENSGLTANGPLATVLATAHGGAPAQFADGTVKVSASFVAGDQRYCREFHLDFAGGGADAVACRGRDGWRIEGWTTSPKRRIAGFETAGHDQTTLGAVIEKLGTRAILDRAGEDKAIAAGWK